MYQILFFILILVLIIGGVMYYVNYRNNLAKKLQDKNKHSSDVFEQRAKNHINNALKEIDFLGGKYNHYLGDNSSSICYDQDKNPIEGCECHPSCSTCGYSKNPIGVNQCLSCRNNTPNNKLYTDGAGWCGSFGPNGHNYNADSNKSSSASSSDNSVFSNAASNVDEAYKINDVSYNQPMTCIEKINRMCSQNQYEDSASWKECLKKNKDSLILAGCNIPGVTDLANVRRETASATQSSSSATGDSNAATNAASSGTASSGAASSGTASSGTASSGTASSGTASSGTAAENKPAEPASKWSPDRPYEHTSQKILGVENVKCTEDFPYPIKPDQDGAEEHVGCSKYPVGSKAVDPETRKLVDRTSIMNACALKGYRYADKSLGGILQRCYSNETAVLENGQKRKCKDNEMVHYQNNPDLPKINSHILNASGKRCYKINQPKTAYSRRVRSTPA